MTPLVYQDETVGYLIELDPQGFMIVSDITELAPVKFISYDGQFEAAREHSLMRDVLEYLHQTKKQLGYSETTNVAAISNPLLQQNVDVRQLKRNEQLWEDMLAEAPAQLALTDSRQYVAPLMSTKWDQASPYNLYTPTVYGDHTPTGCVATSQSQIMYFWKYPSIGIGSHSYIWNGQTLKADFEHPYFWDRMLEDYSAGGTPPESNDAVARLMSDVGISLNMEYSAGGSGTFPDRNNSLVKFFGYSSDIRTVYRTSYSDASAWFEVFRNQVDKGWPSSLAIFHCPSIGHSVVVDGYRTDFGNLIHVNMGWGGFSDAYYSMDEIGVPFVSYVSRYAVINIHPPDTTLPPAALRISSPLAGDDWQAGSSQSIAWTASQAISNVKIEYSVDGGASYATIVASTPNLGTYRWTVPNTPSQGCVIRVSDAQGVLQGTSQVFTISPPRNCTYELDPPVLSVGVEGGREHIRVSARPSFGSCRIEPTIDVNWILRDPGALSLYSFSMYLAIPERLRDRAQSDSKTRSSQ